MNASPVSDSFRSKPSKLIAKGNLKFVESRVSNITFSMTTRGKTLLMLLLLAAWAGRVFAHTPMTSWAVAGLHDERVELEVDMSAESAWTLLGGSSNSAPD